MTSAAGPQGWGRTDGLLVRQPLRAEARHLLLVSGSLTWFRRPRLASPESTNEVEASHPLVKVPPPVYRAQPGRRPGRVRRVPGSARQLAGDGTPAVGLGPPAGPPGSAHPPGVGLSPPAGCRAQPTPGPPGSAHPPGRRAPAGDRAPRRT